ncbi:MAG: hypothetical protein WA913_15800 [Pricia sp.]
MEINNDILLFYGWWQFATCSFAFIALMAIWWHIGKKQKDFGQVWLALSVLCWSISGLGEVYFSETSTEGTYLLEGSRSVLSLLNSLFILLALPWFRYLPKPVGHIIKSKYWIYIVGVPFLFSLLPTLSKMISGKAYGIISELDVYYAFLTLLFLGLVLWESFVKRGLKSLAWLSLATIFVTLTAQFYKLADSPINLVLFSAIFKTTLIMLFFALSLSWVKELIENVIPSSINLRIRLAKEKSTAGKQNLVVAMKGFPGGKERTAVLTPALYELFEKFVQAKRDGNNSWLEIKPKNSMARKNYDINDYNEVKRILITLLDGLFGKNNWTKDKHLVPLKESLFEMSEKRERKIRLAVPKSNIG